MLKLLDREPTLVQVRAGQIGVTTTCAIAIYQAMYDAAPEVVQEPIAHVYRNEYGTVRIDQQYLPSADSFPVFAYPPDAQAEIRERDARIARLENELADALDLKEGNGPTALAMQSAEISRLTEALLRITQVEAGTVTTTYDMRRIALTAIKDEGL